MRRLLCAAAAVTAAALASGCTVPPPPGAAPLRYRDAIFPTVTVTKGITYGSAPGRTGTDETLTLDRYVPAGDTQTLRPAIVLVHGGGFVGGSSATGSMPRLAKAFASRGYVAVSINYRLLGEEPCAGYDPPLPSCVVAASAAQHDAQAAVRFLRANAAAYRLDPSRIAIEGGSAGAATSLLVGVNSGDPGTSGNPGFSSKVGAAMSISASLPHTAAPALFDAADAPILMFNGTADKTVAFEDGVRTAADLYAAKVPVVFEPLEGGGHVPFDTFGDTLVTQSVFFSYAALDLAHAAGQPAAAARAFDAQQAKLTRAHPGLARRYAGRLEAR